MEVKFVSWSNDYNVLKHSASGGIAFELGRYFIEELNGYACGVYKEFGGQARWCITGNKFMLHAFSGSKYWEPKGFDALIKNLEAASKKGKPILFIGTPCQCHKVAKLNLPNLTLVELKCHGYYKKPGVERHSIPWSESWKSLPKDYIDNTGLTKKCKHCPGSFGAVDLILEDGWEVHPSYINEMGTSVVTVKSHAGYNLLTNLRAKGYIHIDVLYDSTPMKKKGRIALLDVHDHDNFGNNLLACNFITYTKGFEYVVLQKDFSFDKIVNTTKGKRGIIFRSIDFLRSDKPSQWLKSGFGVSEIADCEAVVILGGDCWSIPEWKQRWTYWLMLFANMIRHGKKLYFLSNTIGNIPWWAKPFFKMVLSKFAGVYVRDSWSVEELQRLNINAKEYRDLGFLNPANFNTKTEKGDYVVFSPTGLWEKYAETKEEYFKKCYNRVAELMSDGTRVIIMPHSSNHEVESFSDKLAYKTGTTCILPSNAGAARTVFAGAKFAEVYRMHAMIQAWAVGTPVKVHGYSQKYDNIVKQLPEGVMNLRKKAMESLKDLQKSINQNLC